MEEPTTRVGDLSAGMRRFRYKYVSPGVEPGLFFVSKNSNLLKCHINGDASIEMLYFKWSGVVKAGQTVNFGDFTANIPDGKSFFGLFLTPKCTIHISMSYYDNCIFAYSESFSGEIYYDVLMIVR